MLGSLAAMLLLGSGYVEALLQTLLVTGAMLLLLGLAATPRSGIAGIGGLISRYLLSIGLPIEQWLEALANLALHEEDPKAFVEQACAEIAQRLPWVRGGEWVAGGSTGRFGVTDGRRWEFSHGGMVLVLWHAARPVADADLALQPAGAIARAVPCRQGPRLCPEATVLHAGHS